MVTRVSEASMTPSLQTTPTVVVPFRTNWFGMFDISLFSRYCFMSTDDQNSSGTRKTVFSHDSLISVTVSCQNHGITS